MSLLLLLGFMSVVPMIYVSRPLSLGGLIMLLALILTFFLGLTLNSWWGLILFLIYLGALLVLFVYVMAMSPNCFFSRPDSFTFFTYALTMSLMLTLSFLLLLPKMEFFKVSMKFLMIQKPLLLDSFYNVSSLVALSIVLLLAMIAVVSLIPGKVQGSPLRPFS